LAKIKALYNGYYVDISVYLVLISIFFFVLYVKQPCAFFVGWLFIYLILKDKRKEQNETQMKTIHEMINAREIYITKGVN